LSLADIILEEWKKRDPLLQDLEGFDKYFRRRYHLVKRRLEREERKKINMIVLAVKAPIVVWPGYWDLVKDEWKVKAVMYRLLKLMRGDWSEKATDYEAMIYLSTASLSAPLGNEWGRIFCWLFRKFYPDAAEQFGMKDELHDYERQELERLKEWIYRKQREALHM